MGCAGSKSVRSTAAQNRQSKRLQQQKVGLGHSLSEEEEIEQRQRDEERLLHELMRREQADLSRQVRALFFNSESLDADQFQELQAQAAEQEAGTSAETPLLLQQSTEENEVFVKQLKQKQRKKEKLEADAQQKWMIFSSSDLLDESDVQPLSVFMDACMSYVPERKQKILEESHQELSIIDEDTDMIQVRSKHSDMSIVFNPTATATPTTHHSTTSSSSSLPTVPIEKQSSGDDLITVTRKLSSSNKIKVNKEGSLSRLTGLEGMYIGSTTAIETPPVKLNSSANLSDYQLPKGYISSAIAAEVVEVYKKGGRLSRDSVHKILRLGYRHMKELPNTTTMYVSPRDRLTVVGDIHGQLEDLLHILDESQLPSKHNKYIFNGDFVDRGPNGVEVVCILLALYAAWPQSVVLNRGNHEDYAICCVYGFQKECLDKYDEITFGMFCEVFQYLPLFTVVNSKIMVVHGGLFHTTEVTIEELSNIKRHTFTLHDLPDGGETLECVSKSDKRDEYYQQIQRDALWSDPCDDPGLSPSARGAGVNFGGDLTLEFLKRNNLLLVVRSHECVATGFDMPYSGEAHNALCTVFSASNYGGGGNQGAYMVFTNHGAEPGATPVNEDLYYTVHYFDVSSETHNDLTLHGMIINKKQQLLDAFILEDNDNSGLVGRQKWAEIMQRVVGVKIQWVHLLTAIVPVECMEDPVPGQQQKIRYQSFLTDFEALHEHEAASVDGTGGGSEDDINYFLVESLYAQARKLEDIFNFFDADGDGIICIEEMRAGCEKLNTQVPPEARIMDPDRIMRIINVDETGELDMNEFFETYRLLEHYNAARVISNNASTTSTQGSAGVSGNVSGNVSLPSTLGRKLSMQRMDPAATTSLDEDGVPVVLSAGGLKRAMSHSSRMNLNTLDINGVTLSIDK